MIRTRFNSPPDAIILIVGCAVSRHGGRYRDAERIFAVTDLCVLLQVGRGPEDLGVVDEYVGVESADLAQARLVATHAYGDRLGREQFPIIKFRTEGCRDA